MVVKTLTPLQALQQQELFQGIPEKVLKAVLQHVVFQKKSKGQVIFQKGCASQELIFLIAGKAQIINFSEDGKEVGIHFIHPGDFVGELSVIDGQPRSATMLANAESILAYLPASIAKELFIHQPLITQRILQRLCHTVRQATQIRSVLAINRAHTRIYSLLFNAVKRDANNQTTIDSLPNQHTMAVMANVSRETVSRALQVLLKEGIIQKDTKKFIVKDPIKLEQLAKGQITQAA